MSKTVSSNRRKAFCFKDIFDMESWNKTEDGEGKTFKHVRWIPSKGKFNVPEQFVDLAKAMSQRKWLDDVCKGNKVEMVMFAIQKGSLGKTDKRKANLYRDRLECFFYVNGNYSAKEVASMIVEYNAFIEDKGIEGWTITTREFPTTIAEKEKNITELFLKNIKRFE